MNSYNTLSITVRNKQELQHTGRGDEIVANCFFTKNNTKCTFLNFLLKNQKQVIDIHVRQLFIQ